MRRRVLVIPIDEVRNQFQTNSRQNIKIVAPEIMSVELYQFLVAKGERPEKENHLPGTWWVHTPSGEPNLICEAQDFIDGLLPHYGDGPFSLAFANQHSKQDEHYHPHHIEIYYSESPMGARYRFLESEHEEESIHLPQGGVIVFGPEVVHKAELQGFTIVLELPAIAGDKKSQLRC